jgi:HK97 family phage major capsid protein
MSKRDELATKLEGLRSEIDELSAIDEADLTDEQSARMVSVFPEWDETKVAHDALVERDDKVEAVRSASIKPSNRETTSPQVNVRKDPFEGVSGLVRGHGEGEFSVSLGKDDIRARALTAIEQAEGIEDSAKEAATQLVQRNNAAGRLALATGSPEYRSAFEKIVEFPTSYHGLLDSGEQEALRTAMSTTVANGGYAIPFLLDPSIILTNNGTTNPIRSAATVKQGTSNKWNGLTSAGVTAEWKTEGAQAADGSPTVGQPSITAHLADVFAFGSYEVFQDTNLATELPALIADAKDRLESAAFAVGSGSGAPFGVVTSVTAVTTSRVSPTTAGVFTAASLTDVYAVINAVPARHRSNSSWLANFITYNVIRRMGDAAGAGATFWANLGADVPERLVGLPVLESSEVVSAATTGSNILLAGDFKKYYIYDRIGMSLEYIPVLFGTSGRPTAQRGWFATWRVGGDTVDPNAFRVLKL